MANHTNGTKHPKAKLTQKQVDFIRLHAKRRGKVPSKGKYDMTAEELGTKFKVHARTIANIVAGKTYPTMPAGQAAA